MAKIKPSRKQLTAARKYIKKQMDAGDHFPCIHCSTDTAGRFGVKDKKKNKEIPVCFKCYKTGIAEEIFSKLKLLD